MTVPYAATINGIGTTIDLSDKNVYDVICVMRPDSYNSLSMNTLDVFGLNLTYSAITNNEAYADKSVITLPELSS